MVNTYLNWSSLVGIALAVAGAGLYFLRSLRPKLARDYDIFFSAVALLCGGILFFQGWRQDPILQFGQFMLAGSAVFFAVESIRLRGVATEQARRSTPIVDDERPVSQNYRAYQEAEFEELNPYETRTAPRRIRGSRDDRPRRDEYEEDDRPRRSTRPRGDDYSSGSSASRGPSDRPRRRPRTRPDDIPTVDYTDSRDQPDDRPDRDQGDRENRPSRPRSSDSGRSGNTPPGSSRRRPRPAEDESTPPRDRPTDSGSSPSEYVDFRPVDPDEEDNWGDY